MDYRISHHIRHPLYFNAFFLTGMNVVPGISGFVFWMIAGRFYQPDDVGFASAVMSAATLISSIAGLNISMGLIRFLPESSNPTRMINGAYSTSFVMSILVAVVYIFGIPLWSPELIIIRENLFFGFTFTILVIAATLGTIVRDTFVARRKSIFAFKYTFIANIVRIAFVMIGFSVGAIGLIGSNVMGFSISLCIALCAYLLNVEPGFKLKFTINRSDINLLLPYSMTNYIAGLLLTLPQTVLPLLVTNMLGPKANGYAYISLNIGGLIATPGYALASSAFAEGANDPENSSKYLLQAVVLGMLITIPIAITVLIFSPKILLFFGQDYPREATNLLKWLSLSSPFILVNQLFFAYLRIRKQLLPLIVVSGLVGLLTIGISAGFMNSIGIGANGIGIFYGNSLMAITILIHMYQAHKKPNIDKVSPNN